MSHLDTLIRHCGTFAGHGINYEDQPFHGELILEPLLGERGLTTWFRATGIDGTTYHEERCWIAPRASAGLGLWALSSGHPTVTEHALTRTGDGVFTFTHGDPHATDTFRRALTITLHHDGITLAYAWGIPGGPFADRSSVRMQRS